jgi:hypothetical protein
MSTEIYPLKARKFGRIALLTSFCKCSFMHALRRLPLGGLTNFIGAAMLRYPNWGARLQQLIQQIQHQHYMCIELRRSYLRSNLTRCCVPEDTLTLQYVETICLTSVYLISHLLFGLESHLLFGPEFRPPAFMFSHMFAPLPAKRLKAQVSS